ncbi:MAG: CDP-alcohol phosphatidyltransferase family protein [Thermoplasmatota archaeon]
MLDRYRHRADWLFEAMARRIEVPPNVLSLLSLLFAFAAGVTFFLSLGQAWLLVAAALFVAANGLLDALDGKVARLRRLVSPRGDFVDHAVDRFADVLMVGGLAVSGWCSPLAGVGAMAGMLLTSYMGTQAQAVGYGREYSGILGRADRVAILMVAPLVQAVLFWQAIDIFGEPLLHWVMVYFAVAGVATAVQRVILVLRWFQ